MKILYLLVPILILFFNSQKLKAQSPDVIDDISSLIRSSNTKEISKYFASTVELTILTEEDVYSKAQAEQILKNFFNRHAPSSVKIVHRLISNPNYRFGVILITTNKGQFRTSFSMKNNSNKFLITEMRFEYNNE
jgi:Domain of unknown function (DUF4783)